MDGQNTISSEEGLGGAVHSGTTMYVYNARDCSTMRRLAPAAMWRLLRDILRPGIRVKIDYAGYTCGACGQSLTDDLREISDHMYRVHGRQSFVLDESPDMPDGRSGPEADHA
ncbi:MAG: hypothetical protein J4F28_07220 [Nitrosopumilaceae archaeon]|nr:hypothetical protein [Nitrosopumilaceae archaeon]